MYFFILFLSVVDMYMVEEKEEGGGGGSLQLEIVVTRKGHHQVMLYT